MRVGVRVSVSGEYLLLRLARLVLEDHVIVPPSKRYVVSGEW